ncbi:DUF3500 domain-containing protein [Pseudonocardia asaccharolytica]|uniref:DUF3500 domain-containing protein n=1 Tax=Pseudonocardia asaccharolytica DSM 44247 = NBRC 16224 TaxID=1123024 RepID=A0A511D558_9PSEU|nr:DUF3500 domain-containing protein [Pseudonocardia asaccharolytica]GEL18068.1 hypothetical protein PA7_19050 [Pseudonocardia asaccharolytica DSM 44247 = NBRC 16224]
MASVNADENRADENRADQNRADQRRLEAGRTVAARMAEAAAAWLESLDDRQRAVATARAPGSDTESDAERLRWYYTPTDHGGLPLRELRPAQQSRAMQLVASGLSAAGYGTVATIMGLENVLDRTEGWTVDWGRERGRDPGLYYLRVFGEPGASGAWAWRLGGHHVSLNNLVVDGAVRSTTPCFLGADPASSPLLGPAPLRPLGGTEDLARELMRSLPAELAERATLLDRAPLDIIGGNRARILGGEEGEQMIRLPDLWRGRLREPRLAELVARMDRQGEEGTGYDAADHARLALTHAPKGLPGSALDAGQRELLAALLMTYLGRVPGGLTDVPELEDVHLAWAGPTEPGAAHYYRLQGPRLLVEYDNTQRGANHAHSVWRDPEADFGHDVLAAHRAAAHRR